MEELLLWSIDFEICHQQGLFNFSVFIEIKQVILVSVLFSVFHHRMQDKVHKHVSCLLTPAPTYVMIQHWFQIQETSSFVS